MPVLIQFQFIAARDAPMRLISPRNTLISCGNSSMLNFQPAPTRVMRGLYRACKLLAAAILPGVVLSDQSYVSRDARAPGVRAWSERAAQKTAANSIRVWRNNSRSSNSHTARPEITESEPIHQQRRGRNNIEAAFDDPVESFDVGVRGPISGILPVNLQRSRTQLHDPRHHAPTNMVTPHCSMISLTHSGWSKAARLPPPC